MDDASFLAGGASLISLFIALYQLSVEHPRAFWFFSGITVTLFAACLNPLLTHRLSSHLASVLPLEIHEVSNTHPQTAEAPPLKAEEQNCSDEALTESKTSPATENNTDSDTAGEVEDNTDFASAGEGTAPEGEGHSQAETVEAGSDAGGWQAFSATPSSPTQGTYWHRTRQGMSPPAYGHASRRLVSARPARAMTTTHYLSTARIVGTPKSRRPGFRVDLRRFSMQQRVLTRPAPSSRFAGGVRTGVGVRRR